MDLLRIVFDLCLLAPRVPLENASLLLTRKRTHDIIPTVCSEVRHPRSFRTTAEKCYCIRRQLCNFVLPSQRCPVAKSAFALVLHAAIHETRQLLQGRVGKRQPLIQRSDRAKCRTSSAFITASRSLGHGVVGAACNGSRDEGPENALEGASATEQIE